MLRFLASIQLLTLLLFFTHSLINSITEQQYIEAAFAFWFSTLIPFLILAADSVKWIISKKPIKAIIDFWRDFAVFRELRKHEN